MALLMSQAEAMLGKLVANLGAMGEKGESLLRVLGDGFIAREV